MFKKEEIKMKQNDKKSAEDIIKYVGGIENISSLTHCVTRLRFVLKDMSKISQKNIENIPVVMKALETSGQYQVVIGPRVTDIYELIMGEIGNEPLESDVTENNEKIVDKIMSTISAIFTPYINILAAAGVLKGIVILLQMANLFNEKSFIMVTLNVLASGVFTMLPLFIAITGAEKFKSNKFIALALASAMLYPLTAADIPSSVMVGTIAIPLKVYGGAVLPTIFAIYVLAKVEKLLKKIIPDIAKLVFVPTLSLVITGIITFLIIGPLANYLGVGIANGYKWLYDLSPAISGAILAGFGQFFVIFGIHWGIIPLGQINVQVMGYDTIMAMFMSAVFGQFGAVVGSIFTSRDAEEQQLSISASVSAFFGITEPALYGVNVKKRYPFIAGCIGAAVGGMITGLLRVKLYGFAPVLNVFMLGMFNGAQSKTSYEVIAIGLAFIVAFLITIIIGLKKRNSSTQGREKKIIKLSTPAEGRVVPLEMVNDPVFSSKAMGEGFAVIPKNGKIYAPVSGTVKTIFPTKHAVIIESDEGVSIMIHMGIDTVELNGRGFSFKVKENDQVTSGTEIVEINLDVLEKESKDNIIIVVLPESKIEKVCLSEGNHESDELVASLIESAI